MSYSRFTTNFKMKNVFNYGGAARSRARSWQFWEGLSSSQGIQGRYGNPRQHDFSNMGFGGGGGGLFGSLFGGGGGGNGGGEGFRMKSVFICDMPDPHVDSGCFLEALEGYGERHYWDFAISNAIENGGDEGALQGAFDHSREKGKLLNSNSPCTQFGYALADFEIDNWETIESILGPIYTPRRVLDLVSLYKSAGGAPNMAQTRGGNNE